MSDNNLCTFTVENTKLSSTGITFYEISYSFVEDIHPSVELRKKENQIIWRRYSEVRDIYKLLSKKYSFVKLSELPKGSYLDRFKPEIIETRRCNICIFFQDISQSKEILCSKEFTDFLSQTARRSTLPNIGIDRLGFPRFRHTTFSQPTNNPLFENERKETSFKSSHSFQESERDISSSHENAVDLHASVASPEKENNNINSSKKSTESKCDETAYTSPYQSVTPSLRGLECSDSDYCFSSEYIDNTEAIFSGSDESYQAEVEFDSINPLILDPLLQPFSYDTNNETADSEQNDISTVSPDLLNQDPLIQYKDVSNGIYSCDTEKDILPVLSSDISKEIHSDNARECETCIVDQGESVVPEWWNNVADETENALKELEKQTKQQTKAKKKQQQQQQNKTLIHSVYETLPLDLNQSNDVREEELPCPNPVNISNSADTSMAGFEGVTHGGELYSSGIELCKQGRLEEGLTLLENAIEMFFEATRNQNLDANYRKKLRISLKKYLTYAEQVKTQLNEANLQSELNNKSENTENKQLFKTPITLDELRVIEIVKNKLLLVQSSKNSESGQRPFLLKTVQKCRINFADIRHRHIKMSHNLIHSAPHPNVVQLLGSVQSSHLLYLMMEYIESTDLYRISAQYCRGDFLQTRGDDFIRWTTQLISTLEELHVIGLFYLHLCPWDVLISQTDNSIKLTYPIRWEDTPDRLQDPKNLPYIAPECTHPITAVCSEAADWWSLGAICYELVTGQSLMHTHPEGFREGKSVYFPAKCFLHSTLNRDLVCSLISQLLTLNSSERMHYVNTIKQHPIFNNIDWTRLRTSTFSIQSSQEKHF